jgi:hypothetical protein
MILLTYFVLILIYFLFVRDRSIALVFVLIHILSLTGVMFIGGSYSIDTIFKVFNLIYTAVILILIISPWTKVHDIAYIAAPSEIKVKRLTYVLIASSIIPFITFAIVTVLTSIYLSDVNIDIDTFKYAEGVSDEFYYAMPINTTLFILSTYLYYPSIFLIPLHFYYLSKRKFKLSLVCFIFSLNFVLHGMVYFSRAALIHYVLLYFSFLYILRMTLDSQTKRNIVRLSAVIGILTAGYFMYITDVRFSKDELYAGAIPIDSFIRDPVLFSYFEYLSTWYNDSMYVLNSYNFETFTGQISLQPVLSLLSHFGLLDYNTADYMELRKSLWPLHWYRFVGFVAYSVFDYGYLLTVIFSLVYCYMIAKLKPLNNSTSLLDLFAMVLLIQLPLFAIFYSTVGGLLLPLLFLIPIYGYLRMKF